MDVPLLEKVFFSLYQSSSTEADNIYFAKSFESRTAPEGLLLHFNFSMVDNASLLHCYAFLQTELLLG